ncbi:hypothetical protein [Phytoactinopolyspora limicola]|uniref:hypothetical protein n=1 Tax=Phytoactinopolyspora limicola TaxID=2715536 RepID=UPI001407BEDB|nr:hypothetical protein [Phytoactinopolyspora limicola]
MTTQEYSLDNAVLVGSTTVDITPPVGAHLAGFAVRVEPSVDVHDPLLATAIATSGPQGASIIVTGDLISLDPADADMVAGRIADETGVDRDSIAISVSHTHGGPKVKAVGFGVGRDEEYVTRAFAALVDAARTAWKTRQPAQLRTGVAHLETVAHNRRGTGVIDPLVFGAQWADLRGQPIVTLFSHACHPVTLGPDNLSITADWPGAARRRLQARFGGEVAFLQGCCGQINTGHLATDSFSTEPSPDRTFEAAERIGRAVADATSEALATAELVPVGRISAETTRVWLPTQPAPAPEVLSEWARQWRVEATATAGPERALFNTWSQWAEYWRGRESTGGIDVPVSVHRWGRFMVVALPGEPFVEFALDLRRQLNRPDLLVVGYTGGVPGYIPLREADYDAGGYEIDIAYRSSRLFSGPYARHAGQRLLAAAVELARSGEATGAR